jgi:hypothetical protein
MSRKKRHVCIRSRGCRSKWVGAMDWAVRWKDVDVQARLLASVRALATGVDAKKSRHRPMCGNAHGAIGHSTCARAGAIIRSHEKTVVPSDIDAVTKRIPKMPVLFSKARLHHRCSSRCLRAPTFLSILSSKRPARWDSTYICWFECDESPTGDK